MSTYGFTLLRETVIDELASTARLWRHASSGGSVLSFCNNDENKVFGVSFRTPPADSTGVAHILEHSVLCGSEKYPVKEPFVELLKGSLQTFLNAFTYPDKTCYPVASANLKDLRNLTDVYLDAVFFPKITQAIFQQEGWHLEPGDNNSGLLLKGVVYNEMKGAFSSPESVLSRHCLHSLFPDTLYSLESGGDPQEIPRLRYTDFLAFHRAYYHPANARFFFWGDDPEPERLARLAITLERFANAPFPDTGISAIALQPGLNAERRITVPFAASEEEKGMVVVNWLGPDVMEVELALAFHMLEHMLLGMPASPLRRILIESGLGEDIAGQGLEAELRQLCFGVGLKGVPVEKTDMIEALILDTLRDLAADGLPADAVEAAVNSVEFSLRENNFGRFPVGLSVMLRALSTWLYDGDPLAPLRFEKPLQAIKDALHKKERYFENLLSRWFINNRHRTTVILRPDVELADRQEQAEKERAAALGAAMSTHERACMEAELLILRQRQTTPDKEEELALIPRLSIADLPAENPHIPTERLAPPHWDIFFHPLPTNGIVYAEAAFALDSVPEDLLPLLPLFGRALLEMGTRSLDFVTLHMSIARKTGGMDIDTLFMTRAGDRAPVARLILSGKTSPGKVTDLFALMRTILTDCLLDQKDRFRRMVLEETARQEHGMIPTGHIMVATRLRAALSGAGRLAEITGGVSYLHFLHRLNRQIDTDWTSVVQALETLRHHVIHRAGAAVNLTATPAQGPIVQRCAEELLYALPEHGQNDAAAWRGKPASLHECEALLLPAQVNYMGKGVNLFDVGYNWHGSAMVILKYLRTGYLWEKIRVQGGAYGCLCGLDRMSGDFYMASYRDPNILPTLAAYDAVAEHLAGHTLARTEIEPLIIGAIGELDHYLLPDAKGSAAFSRRLCGDTDSLRAKLREDILSTSAEHFQAFGQSLHNFSAAGRICALGGGALERVARERGWHVEKVL
jgi:Zn-dependent M16 (insulinase) family peptidase